MKPTYVYIPLQIYDGKTCRPDPVSRQKMLEFKAALVRRDEGGGPDPAWSPARAATVERVYPTWKDGRYLFDESDASPVTPVIVVPI